MFVGFSTGCLYKFNNIKQNIKLIKKVCNSIEITFLKDPLLTDIKDLISYAEDLHFESISIHGPKILNNIPAEIIIENLIENVSPWYHIIMHPDVIYNDRGKWWNALSTQLCIENMDHRLPEFSKPDSRKLRELLGPPDSPRFSFCFDMAHTQFIDPTMNDARNFLNIYGKRFLQQYHISEISYTGDHIKISEISEELLKIPEYILDKTFIIESTVNDNVEDTLKREYEKVMNILTQTQKV